MGPIHVEARLVLIVYEGGGEGRDGIPKNYNSFFSLFLLCS